MRVSSFHADVTYCVYSILRGNQDGGLFRIGKPSVVLSENMSSSETEKWQTPDDAASDGEDGGSYLLYHHEPLASKSASSSESEDGPLRSRGESSSR